MLYSVRPFEKYRPGPADLGCMRRLFIGAAAWEMYLQLGADINEGHTRGFTRTTLYRTLLLVNPKGEKFLELSNEALVPVKMSLKGGRISSPSDVGSLWRASPHSPLCQGDNAGETKNFSSKLSALLSMKAPSTFNFPEIWVKQKDLDKITSLRGVKFVVNLNKERQ